MTLLLAGRHPELFRAAVDIFGPSNLFTFLESVPEDWKPVMEKWLGDAERDRERLTKDSPITYLDQMVNPMLVIQGANDPRVVKAESDQIVEALQQKGLDVEYLVLDDEGMASLVKRMRFSCIGACWNSYRNIRKPRYSKFNSGRTCTLASKRNSTSKSTRESREQEQHF